MAPIFDEIEHPFLSQLLSRERRLKVKNYYKPFQKHFQNSIIEKFKYQLEIMEI